MSVPLIKLGYLLIRTISKPIAKIVTNQAASHPRFRELCIKLSQSYHRMEVNMRTRISTSGESAQHDVRPLNDQKAIQLGGTISLPVMNLANFIGEFVIFAVAGAVLLGETLRSNAAEKQKKEILEKRILSLESSVVKLHQLEHVVFQLQQDHHNNLELNKLKS